jgi:hypothetical protein
MVILWRIFCYCVLSVSLLSFFWLRYFTLVVSMVILWLIFCYCVLSVSLLTLFWLGYLLSSYPWLFCDVSFVIVYFLYLCWPYSDLGIYSRRIHGYFVTYLLLLCTFCISVDLILTWVFTLVVSMVILWRIICYFVLSVSLFSFFWLGYFTLVVYGNSLIISLVRIQ